MVDWQRLGLVLVMLGLVSVSSGCVTLRAGRDAYASDEIDVFLAGFRRAVLAHDLTLLLGEYIDPIYRCEQLEGLLNGDRGQFFDELFGLGKHGFGDIAAMEFLTDAIQFEPLGDASRSGTQLAQIPVQITYRDGTRIEDAVFVLKYADRCRTFTIDGPRG